MIRSTCNRFCSLMQLGKALFNQTAKMSSATEVQFPVPWGHIAGKAWGDPAGKPVLAIHGWQDNAGSFDRLIPMLPQELHIVAIDLPGHGQSSHRPVGAQYNVFEYVLDLKYVVDALEWNKFMLLAHSLGAGAATWFAGSLPDMVEALVCLEGFGFYYQPVEVLPQSMGIALKTLSAPGNKDLKTFPTWDAVVDRISSVHQQSQRDFSREAAAILAVRGTKQLDNGEYQFTRDMRLKEPSLLRMTKDVNQAFIDAVQCPILFILGEDSYLPPRLFSPLQTQGHDPQKIQVVRVPGDHHLHLETPEIIHKRIGDFLLTKKLAIDSQGKL